MLVKEQNNVLSPLQAQACKQAWPWPTQQAGLGLLFFVTDVLTVLDHFCLAIKANQLHCIILQSTCKCTIYAATL